MTLMTAQVSYSTESTLAISSSTTINHGLTKCTSISIANDGAYNITVDFYNTNNVKVSTRTINAYENFAVDYNTNLFVVKGPTSGGAAPVRIFCIGE